MYDLLCYVTCMKDGVEFKCAIVRQNVTVK